MRNLSQLAVEVIGSVWLVIVAVQYFSRYFVRTLDIDLTYTYVGMLFIIAAVSFGRLCRAARDALRKSK